VYILCVLVAIIEYCCIIKNSVTKFYSL